MKILIVEDDPKTSAFLQKGLTEEGYTVDVAFDGEEGLTRAKERNHDLLILDVMMPKMDGWAVIEQLRKASIPTMTLFLTARDSLQDRVRGLDLGADAYLVKPFSFSELLAVVRTLLRRSPSRSNDHFQLNDLEIDFMERKVMRARAEIELTPNEYSLLSLLAKRKGEVISRTAIASHVWKMNFDSETNVVEVLVGRLRFKIDGAYPKKLINTIRGMGYALDDRA
jgi:two-component system, OmpR family, copper resistance phosphate regulon response regulator CusR